MGPPFMGALFQVPGSMFPVPRFVTSPASRGAVHGARPARFVTLTVPAFATDVMAMPTTGGPARTLASVPNAPGLMLGGDAQAIYWLSGVPWEPGGRRLSFLLRGEQQARVCRGYDGAGLPSLFGGRLYWVAYPGVLGSASALRWNLVSANPDGSDRRTITSGAPERPNPRRLDFLSGDGRSLYAVGSTLAPQRGSEATHAADWEINIYRIRPERPCPLELILRLPYGSRPFLAGDYVYYLIEENRERWFDWSREGLALQKVSVLYRRRLPD
jgi:hypothetical protein